MIRRVWSFPLSVVVLHLLATPVVLAQDPITASIDSRNSPHTDISRWMELESRVLPPAIVPGPRTHDDLTEYYGAANPCLKRRLEQIQSASRTGSTGRSITLVAGAAGIGKTFLLRMIRPENDAEGTGLKVDLRELYDEWKREGQVIDKPELQVESMVLSSAMAVKREDRHLLREWLAKRRANLIVLDALDEVHPDDHLNLLQEIEAFVVHSEQSCLNVVVLGRPCAFRAYWRERWDRSPRELVEMHVLNPPRLRTTGDLLVSNWNYDVWRHQLHWSPDGVTRQSMTLDAYARWANQAFARRGRFSTVSFTPTDLLPERNDAVLTQWAQNHRFVNSALCNLRGNGVIHEMIENSVRLGRELNESDIMRRYLKTWLEREAQASGRPSADNQTHLDLYLLCLQAVAVKYSDLAALDDRGFFTVGKPGVVEVPWKGRTLNVPVARLLNRSGFAVVDLHNVDETRYRFEPFWMHRLLVETHHEQVFRGTP